ncbi:hypothetical protein LZ190_01395 [Rhodovulum sulfidophilum]|nr:hypothetical protein [Rhodovulum sulfidophilum]
MQDATRSNAPLNAGVPAKAALLAPARPGENADRFTIADATVRHVTCATAPEVSTSVARIDATDVAEPQDVTTLARVNAAAECQAQATGRSGRRPCPGYLSRRSTAMLA